MSSSFPSLDHLPKLTDENPTVLTIRSGDASASLLGAYASSYGFGSPQGALSSLGSANSGFKNSGPEAAVTVRRTGVQRAEDIEINTHVEKVGSGFGTRSYEGGGGAGGKLRSSRRVNKRTPYERPLTAGGSSDMASLPSSKKLTIASRLRNSATQFIHSSASYLFSAVFKHSPPSLEADEGSQGLSIPMKQEPNEGMPVAPTKQNAHSVLANQFPALTDADVKPVLAESSVLDIDKIEEILKQKTLSRDQVDRLTQILQKHMLDTLEANNIVESEKLQDQPTVDTKDTSPIQVARAYMGEQATRTSGLAATVPPDGMLVEGRYASSPFSRGWARGSASMRMPKRSLAIEDDMSLLAPVRRVRQKTSLITTASPASYARRMTGPNKLSETRTSSPPSQSSQTAMKILETLEKLSPSPQGKLRGAMTEKSVIGPQVLDKLSPPGKGKVMDNIASVAITGAGKYTPQTSRAREKSVVQNLNSVDSPKSAETKVNGKATFGDVNLTGAELKLPLVKTPSSMPQSHKFLMLSEGFRMNAVFEETMSDEEVKSQAKPQLSSVVEAQVVCSRDETILTSVLPFTKADVSVPSAISLSEPVHVSSSISASFFMVNSSTPPHIAAVSHEPTKNLLSLPSFSFPAVATEAKLMLSDAAVSSSAAAAAVSLSDEKGHNVTAVKPATPLSCNRSSEAAEPTVVSSSVITSARESTLTAQPVSLTVGTGSSGNAPTDVAGVSSPVLPTSNTDIDPSESKNVVIMATESLVTDRQGEGNTMSKEAAISVGASPAFLAPNLLLNANLQPSVSSTFLFAAGTSGTPLLASPSAVGGGLGTGSAGASASSLASPFSFSTLSSTTSAPNFYNGISASLPSTQAFVFGGQSSKTLTEEKPMFATGASVSALSVSPFAFGAQPATVQEPNMAAKPIFSQSCSSSTGQTPCFGASLSSLVNNPFQSTAGSSSSFLFGPSNAALCGPTSASSSLSSVFTSIPSFGGASSMFQTGAPAISSPSISGPAASSTTASSLTTSLFSSSPAPSASGIPAYSFGAVAASPPGSASSTTQPFAFGAAQANPFSANAFSSSGKENTSFNFRATACFSTTMSGSSTLMFGSNIVPNVFAFASTCNSSPFAFGSGQPSTQQATIPVASTFGNQPAAAPSNNGQAFVFNGGQAAASAQTPAPAPNPFSAAGTTQPGLGFSLGATGGDKSGRKYIKAKRIGGAKKGK